MADVSKKPFGRASQPITLEALEAISGGVNLRNISVTVPQGTLDNQGSVNAEYAADLQAAQVLHRDPSVDVVTYDGRGPGDRYVSGAYTRENYYNDLHAGNMVIRNDEVVSNAPGSVNDRFSGLENPPYIPFNSSSSSSPSDTFNDRFNAGGSTFDERFSGSNGMPSWVEGASYSSPGGHASWPSESGGGATRSIGSDEFGASSGGSSGFDVGNDHFDTSSGPTQTFDDGSSLTTFDDGSTLAQGSDGSFSSTPSYDDQSGGGGGESSGAE